MRISAGMFPLVSAHRPSSQCKMISALALSCHTNTPLQAVEIPRPPPALRLLFKYPTFESYIARPADVSSEHEIRPVFPAGHRLRGPPSVRWSSAACRDKQVSTPRLHARRESARSRRRTSTPRRARLRTGSGCAYHTCLLLSCSLPIAVADVWSFFSQLSSQV